MSLHGCAHHHPLQPDVVQQAQTASLKMMVKLGLESNPKGMHQPKGNQHSSMQTSVSFHDWYCQARCCLSPQGPPERGRLHWTVLLLPAGIAAFLGTWQVGRQQWKLEQVQQRQAGLQVCQLGWLPEQLPDTETRARYCASCQNYASLSREGCACCAALHLSCLSNALMTLCSSTCSTLPQNESFCRTPYQAHAFCIMVSCERLRVCHRQSQWALVRRQRRSQSTGGSGARASSCMRGASLWGPGLAPSWAAPSPGPHFALYFSAATGSAGAMIPCFACMSAVASQPPYPT